MNNDPLPVIRRVFRQHANEPEITRSVPRRSGDVAAPHHG